jgi:hypothetical protein
VNGRGRASDRRASGQPVQRVREALDALTLGRAHGHGDVAPDSILQKPGSLSEAAVGSSAPAREAVAPDSNARRP